MYSVLLVDDEELDLEGMRRFVPWAQLGMEVKGCVNNALSACDILDEQPIDILVSDVNMPYMSGLELAKTALQRKPDIRIIFVSGYQEFSYVQQALSLKAYNYVLKPMDDNELVATLLKVKRDLDKEAHRREEEQAYRQLLPMARNDMLIRLLEGEADAGSEPAAKRLGAFGLERLNWPVRVAVAELDHPNRTDGAPEPQELSKAFWEAMHDTWSRAGSVPFGRLSSYRIALLLEEDRQPRLLDLLREACVRQPPLSVTTGLGEPARSPEELASSYRQAVSAVEAKMFLGKGSVINYEDVRGEPEMLDFRLLDARMNELLNAVDEYELVHVCDGIDKLFESMTKLRSEYTVRNLSGYIVWKLEQHLNARDENLFELLDIDIRRLDVLMQLETIDEIRNWLTRRLFELSEKLRDKSNAKESKFIRSVVRVMKERMHENITLKDIAQHFSFSPSYLGYLIKEKSGFTFSELLVQFRMEKACELLKQPGIKIYEVADRAGYRYLPYFSRQFKERFGMTPLEYRKREQ